MKIDKTTPKSTALGELGQRLAQVRKQRGYTQTQLSREAGLGVATLRRIEDGQDAQIGSWFKLLKALDMMLAIDALLPESFSSPMREVKATRKRARKAFQHEDEAGEKAKATLWGDERL